MKKTNGILIIPPTSALDSITSPLQPSFALPILNTPLVIVNIRYLQAFTDMVYIVIAKEYLDLLKVITVNILNIEYIIVEDYIGIHRAIHINLDKIDGDRLIIHKNSSILNIDIKCFDLNCDVFCFLKDCKIRNDTKKEEPEIKNKVLREKILKAESKIAKNTKYNSEVYVGYTGNRLLFLKRKNIKETKFIFGNRVVKFDSCCDIMDTIICSRNAFLKPFQGKSFKYDFLSKLVDSYKVKFEWVEEDEYFRINNIDAYVNASVFYKTFYDFPRVTNEFDCEKHREKACKEDNTHKKYLVECINHNNNEYIIFINSCTSKSDGEMINMCDTSKSKETKQQHSLDKRFYDTLQALRLTKFINTLNSSFKCENLFLQLYSKDITQNVSTKENKLFKKIYKHQFVHVFNFMKPNTKRVTFENRPDIRKTVIGCKFDFCDNFLKNSIIGDNVYIGKNSRVSSSFVMNNVSIGDNCTINESIIGVGSFIGDDVSIYMCVIKSGTQIKYGTFRNKNIG